MHYLDSKQRKSHPFVLENREYLNLASLAAGPLVYLLVEFQCRFYSKIKEKQKSKKEVLPELLDNAGKPVFQESSAVR